MNDHDHYRLCSAHFVGMILEALNDDLRLTAIQLVRRFEHRYPSNLGTAVLSRFLIKLERYKMAPNSIRNIRTATLELRYGDIIQDYILSLPEHVQNSAIKDMCVIIQTVCTGNELNRLEQRLLQNLMRNL